MYKLLNVHSSRFQVLPIRNSPGRKVYEAHLRMRQCLSDLFAEAGYDLSTECWATLSHLWEKDGLTQAELAQRLEKDGPSTSRLVDALSATGYVERRMSPDDRRSRIICLTKKGQAVRGPLTRIATGALAYVFDDVSDRDLDVFVRVLDHIITRLDSRRDGAPPRRLGRSNTHSEGR